MSLRHDDFEDLVLKCVRNDTGAIDHVAVAGIYYESDGWDSYLTGPIESHVINAAISYDDQKLSSVWNDLVHEYARNMILKRCNESDPRRPISDIHFEVGNQLFIRPRPRFHRPSDFYPGGKRPRIDSTNTKKCPPVATVLPDIDYDEWKNLRSALHDPEMLQGSYRAWNEWLDEELERSSEELKPAVKFPLNTDLWIEKMGDRGTACTFRFLCDEASMAFTRRCRELATSASLHPDELCVGSPFILAETMEIGGDVAFDISTIRYISETPGLEREKVLVRNARIFHEHALGVSAAYAVNYGCDHVFYTLNSDYRWE